MVHLKLFNADLSSCTIFIKVFCCFPLLMPTLAVSSQVSYLIADISPFIIIILGSYLETSASPLLLVLLCCFCLLSLCQLSFVAVNLSLSWHFLTSTSLFSSCLAAMQSSLYVRAPDTLIDSRSPSCSWPYSIASLVPYSACHSQKQCRRSFPIDI